MRGAATCKRPGIRGDEAGVDCTRAGPVASGWRGEAEGNPSQARPLAAPRVLSASRLTDQVTTTRCRQVDFDQALPHVAFDAHMFERREFDAVTAPMLPD